MSNVLADAAARRGPQSGQAEHASRAILKASLFVLCDLLEQGWDIELARQAVYLRPPTASSDRRAAKDQVRAALEVERDEQLREPSVRSFIAEMERGRMHAGKRTSIFSLMRDGPELASALGTLAEQGAEVDRTDALCRVVDPYIQVVRKGERCEFTGFALSEIWRYFRHTWATPYKTLPGREFCVLIRDRASPRHPVVGIAALGSSVVQLAAREKYIGWDGDSVLEWLESSPTKRAAEWLHSSLDAILSEIWIADLLAGISYREARRRVNFRLVRGELNKPTKPTIQALQRLAKSLRQEHGAGTRQQDGLSWRDQAKTALFTSKRALALARLLQIRAGFVSAGFAEPTTKGLRSALKSTGGRAAIHSLVREIKARSVGVKMMDIIVCGAVDPYRPLLGGKLVSMLVASPEIVEEYNRRYAGTPSTIASSLAGREIARDCRLVFLGTTSLYGTGSSQYNRIKVPGEAVGSDHPYALEYIEVGKTEGYGTLHFGRDTMDALSAALEVHGDYTRVNYRFGEGTSPRMRKIREGLTQIGLDANALLKHGNPRIIYAVPLAENYRAVLLGLAERPRYLIPQRDPHEVSAALARYWLRRWVSPRIGRPEVLESVARHDLSYPIDHGARVVLPEDEAEAQFALSF